MMWVQRIPKLYSNTNNPGLIAASPMRRKDNKRVKAKRLHRIVAINDSMEAIHEH
jgi:hypothetical protein